MKNEELYKEWKETRRQVTSSESFVENVMSQIYKHEQEQKNSSFIMKRLVDFISAHPFAQAAFIATGCMTGFIRMIFIIIAILNKGNIYG